MIWKKNMETSFVIKSIKNKWLPIYTSEFNEYFQNVWVASL